MIFSAFHTTLFHLFHDHGNFWYQIFSQGSVARYTRYGGIFNNHFITNFLGNLRVKKNLIIDRFDSVTAMCSVSLLLLEDSVTVYKLSQ